MSSVRQFLRARFYRSTKIRFSLILPLRESCWGVPSPNPAYAACAAEKSLKIIFRIFQKQFRFTPCFSPISERTPRTAERRFYHAKTIQHTAPQPGSQNTHDRGRIRRVCRKAFCLQHLAIQRKCYVKGIILGIYGPEF